MKVRHLASERARPFAGLVALRWDEDEFRHTLEKVHQSDVVLRFEEKNLQRSERGTEPAPAVFGYNARRLRRGLSGERSRGVRWRHAFAGRVVHAEPRHERDE